MKKYIKKIIVGIVSFAFLFSVGQAAFAYSAWNDMSNDCSSINIANYTQNVGYGNCWTETTINADPGDTINVRIYYHNTGNVTNTDTKIKLNAPTGSSTSHSFSGQITSPQGNLSTGSVRVNIPSSQTLTFGSVKWYPNQSRSASSFLNGQDGSEILGSGLNIGDIKNTNSGWATQGTVVISFKVGSNVVSNCSITTDFTVNNSSYANIMAGDSANLRWGTTGCASVEIKDDNGATISTAVSGNKTVSPTETTSYTMTARSSSGATQTRSVTVNVDQPATCSLNTFSANPSEITRGDNSTLSWGANNCEYFKLFKSGTILMGTYYGSSMSVSPITTTTYTLKAYSANNALGGTKTTNVTVGEIMLDMTGTISASHSSCTITSGNSTCTIPFTWSTQNPEGISAVTRSPSSGFTSQNANSRNNFSLPVFYGSNTFYLYNSGTELDRTSVSASCSSGTSWNGSICEEEEIITNNCAISKFVVGNSSSSTATTIDIISGDSTTLYWNTTDCDHLSFLPSIGSSSLSGSKVISPTIDTTYKLTAYGSNGSSKIKYVTVNVQEEDIPVTSCVIDSFTPSDFSIEEGDSVVLNWKTTGCTRAKISDIGTVPVDGSDTVEPTDEETEYILTAYASNGASKTKSVTIYVDQDNNSSCKIDSFTASDTSIEDGDTTELKWKTTGCTRAKISDIGTVSVDGSEDVDPSEDTAYVLTAYASNGSTRTKTVRILVDENDNDINGGYCSIDTFSANKTYINRGDSATLKWNTTDCDNVNISNVGSVADDGSRSVYPTSTITYLLRAYGIRNGTQSRSIQINVANNYQPPVINKDVITTVATNISQTGAQLNGLLVNSNNGSSNTYFEYGTSINLGNRTASRTTNGNTNFNDYISGLKSKTVYYFRAVAEDSNGISYGNIEVFQTIGATVIYRNTDTVREVVVQGPTIYGSASPIMLEISNRYQTIGLGDIIDYTVFYKNISSSTLTYPMVQVYIPQGITLINYSEGTYSEDNKTLSVPINNLRPNDEGYIYLQARVDSIEANLAQIVTTAILVYTNPNGAQENAMAYVLNNPKIMNNNSLGGAAFFSGFGGIGLIGWLFIIILILLIILLARCMYGRRETTVIQTHK